MNEKQAPNDELTWSRGDPGVKQEENKATVKAISRLIKTGERKRVLAILRRWHPRDVVELLVHLPLKRARKLFVYLPAGRAAKVIAELNDDFRAALLADATLERLVAILDSLDPEVATDALEELPDEVEALVLPRLRESESVGELRSYKEDSAGGIMTRKLVAVPPTWTVGQVVSEIRRRADLIKKIDSVYVIDQDRRLVGYLKLRDLLLQPDDSPVSAILRTEPVSVSSEMDQEEVAHITEQHGLLNVPVVDGQGRLLGRVTSDQLQQVLREEAEEDIHLLGGVSPDARPDEPLWGIVRSRLPWLLAGLFGATVSGSIVGSFEAEIATAAVLASFIPIVMSMAGNAGIQAATVAIQGLATDTIWIGDLGWRLGKELLGAMVNGLAAALVLAAIVLIVSQFAEIESPLRLAVTAAIALTGVTLLAVAMGASVPLILNHFGIDPAMATGIFITTGNDIIAVLVFFLVVTQVYFV
jgi:magnesium transporter